MKPEPGPAPHKTAQLPGEWIWAPPRRPGGTHSQGHPNASTHALLVASRAGMEQLVGGGKNKRLSSNAAVYKVTVVLPLRGLGLLPFGGSHASQVWGSRQGQGSRSAGLPYLPRHPPRLPVGLRVLHGFANFLHQFVQLHRCFHQNRAELLTGVLHQGENKEIVQA